MRYRWLKMGVARGLAVLGLVALVSVSAVADPSDSTALWLRQGKPLPVALDAVRILQQAGDEGLDPRDYSAPDLTKAVNQAQSGLSASAQIVLANALDLAMRRYLHDLHYGRVDPASVYANFNVPPKTLDVAINISTMPNVPTHSPSTRHTPFQFNPL